jgi:putative transposase
MKVRHGKPGRPAVPEEVRALIRTMSRKNPLWGAPRIHGELLKLGIDIGQTSVSKYLVRRRKPPSQTWRTFLNNDVKTMVSVDFFTVPTIRFQVLYVFLVLAHDRRRILHFGVTAHPTAEWTAQQLREAFPWETPPRYLLRDRDGIFGPDFVKQVKAMGIKQVLAAPRSPWQRACVERVIGTLRRECLDHVIVFSEAGLSRHLRRFAHYYHRSRTHLGLQKDTPESAPSRHQKPGGSLRSRRSAVSIIVTNVAPPEPRRVESQQRTTSSPIQRGCLSAAGTPIRRHRLTTAAPQLRVDHTFLSTSQSAV